MRRRPLSEGFENDVLRAFPQDELPQRRQLLDAIHDGREVVAGQLSHLACEDGRAVAKQDFRFADAAGIEQQLPRRRIAGVVLVPEPQLEVAEWDPGRLSAPARLDDA